MNCPVCSIDLQVAERQGFEIDFCPRCRGVWLDRGELEKIIDRARPYDRDDDDDDDDDRRRYSDERRRYEDDRRYYDQASRDGRGNHAPPPRKREGFFSRLFDFGD